MIPCLSKLSSKSVPDLPILVDPWPLEPMRVVEETAVLFLEEIVLSVEPTNLARASEVNLLADGFRLAGSFEVGVGSVEIGKSR